MTTSTTTSSLTERCRIELASLIPRSYRYYKTTRQWREPFDDGTAYLTINVTHGGGGYYLAFYIETVVNSLEDRISALLSKPRRTGSWERSITCYSMNIGPESPHWRYPFWPWWAFNDVAKFEDHAKEIRAFTLDLAIPFLATHRSPEAIRKTLMETPGHAINLEPYKQILVASLMSGDRKRLLEDVQKLEARYAGFGDTYRTKFEDVRDRVLLHSEAHD